MAKRKNNNKDLEIEFLKKEVEYLKKIVDLQNEIIGMKTVKDLFPKIEPISPQNPFIHPIHPFQPLQPLSPARPNDIWYEPVKIYCSDSSNDIKVEMAEGSSFSN